MIFQKNYYLNENRFFMHWIYTDEDLFFVKNTFLYILKK